MAESTVKPKVLEVRKVENGQAHVYHRTNITSEQREGMDGETYTIWVYDEAKYQIPTTYTDKEKLLAAIRNDSALRTKLAAMAEKLGVTGGAVQDKSNWTRANEVVASPHWAVVSAFDAAQPRPLNVTRTWCGHQIGVDCYVTQDVADNYQAGNLKIGDYVLVDFVDGELDKPLAVGKIYKSW